VTVVWRLSLGGCSDREPFGRRELVAMVASSSASGIEAVRAQDVWGRMLPASRREWTSERD